MDFINADDLLNARFQTADNPYRLGWNDALEAARENAPRANVRLCNKGHWEDNNGSKGAGQLRFTWWCSECGHSNFSPVAKTLEEFSSDNHFCRWCGADMMEE